MTSIFAKVVLPQLESLGTDIFPKIESLMTAMYTVSIPEFQPGIGFIRYLKYARHPLSCTIWILKVTACPRTGCNQCCVLLQQGRRSVIQEYPKTWGNRRFGTSGVRPSRLTFKNNLTAYQLWSFMKDHF
jgi:hypothetical protein